MKFFKPSDSFWPIRLIAGGCIFWSLVTMSMSGHFNEFTLRGTTLACLLAFIAHRVNQKSKKPTTLGFGIILIALCQAKAMADVLYFGHFSIFPLPEDFEWSMLLH